MNTRELFATKGSKKGVLKTANLPIPKLIVEQRQLILTRYPLFSTFDIANLIVAQYPSLSFDGQRRLVQYAIVDLKNTNFDSNNLFKISNADFEPNRKSGTDYYNRQATKTILECMQFKVIDDDRNYSQY